jgi:hypothetical protein
MPHPRNQVAPRRKEGMKAKTSDAKSTRENPKVNSFNRRRQIIFKVEKNSNFQKRAVLMSQKIKKTP